MKILTVIAAVSLMGLASCGQKMCPAYSKTDAKTNNVYAKEVTKADTNRI